METIKKIQSKNLELNSLLNDLNLSVKVEKKIITYELKKDDSLKCWHLISIELKKIVVSGSMHRINSYCRLRNIKKSTILETEKI